MSPIKYTPEHHHKKHRNVLYSLVVVLAILQIITFATLSIQTSKINVKLDSTTRQLSDEIDQSAFDQQQFTTSLMQTYDSLYQKNFIEISENIRQQQDDFEDEIDLLKSSQEDFSGIAEDAVRSVVTVSVLSSIGSGFIVHPEGYIVTNYHVIQGQEETIRVLTYDRKVFQAELIGIDEQRDIALLKIPGEYESLELIESSTLQVGKKVIAIGNPLGLSFTVTEGIISALHRVGPSGLAEYVQTDVSLNPGNSGGPLIDIQGKVVGINNFKVGGAEALGFALESDAIRDAVNLIANQTITL